MRRMGSSWWDRHYRLASWGLAVAILLLLLHAVNLKLAPLFRSAAQLEAHNLAAQVVNEEVEKLMQGEGESFAVIERAEDGKILSVGLDVGSANRFKAQLTQNILQKLDNFAGRSIEIPLGTILGAPLLHGRGPSIPFVVQPYTEVEVEFAQSFSSAGINQTLYQVRLEIQVNMQAALSREETSASMSTSFLLEERLIAGEVPQFFVGSQTS